MRSLSTLVLLAWLVSEHWCDAATVTLPPVVKVKVGRLGKIEAQAETPVRWVNLHADLDLIGDSSSKFAIVLGAKKGVYRIAAYTGDKDGPSDPAYCDIIVGDDSEVTPPVNPPKGKANPADALLRLRFGNSGCTATVIGPQRSDGKWNVLTAAHCTGPAGTAGQATTKDGRTFRVIVTQRNTQADISWLIGEISDTDLPFAELATEEPAKDTPVWHAGYGIDRPGNKETGKVVSGVNSEGQIQFLLSVSSGDSGGGIFRADNGKLVGCVCCTSGMARLASMWGGSSVVALRMLAKSERIHPLLEFDD